MSEPVSNADELDRLRAEVAALKAKHDPLAEMWRELSEYQPQADADGHGESWRVMCEERTAAAASVADRVALAAGVKAAGAGAVAAATAAWAASRSAAWAAAAAEAEAKSMNAIASIRKAKEAK